MAQLTASQNGDFSFKYQPSPLSEELCVRGSKNIRNPGLLLKTGSLSSDGDSSVFAQWVLFTLCLFKALGCCRQTLTQAVCWLLTMSSAPFPHERCAGWKVSSHGEPRSSWEGTVRVVSLESVLLQHPFGSSPRGRCTAELNPE